MPGERYVGLTSGARVPSLVAQLPPTQACEEEQTVAHEPQLFGSVVRLVHPVPEQQVFPVEHGCPPLHAGGGTQTPFEQVSPTAQRLLQAPQLIGSEVTSVQPDAQQPLVPVQTGPPLHVDVQLEFTQRDPAGHWRLQAPQWFASLVMSVQPASQQVFVPVQAGPPLHVDAHCEFTHFAPYGQEYPQPPQSFGSLVVSAHPFQQHVCEPLQMGPPLHVGAHCELTQLDP